MCAVEIPSTPHWLVDVARSAELAGADDLSVRSDASIGAAWAAACDALGIPPEDLARHVARHFRMTVADLDEADPHAIKLLQGSVAHRLGVLPLEYSDRTLVLATSDHVTLSAETEIREASARTPEFRVVPPEALRAAIDLAYRGADDDRPAPATAGTLRRHILVVDDDPDQRLLLRRVLESVGFVVSEAMNGRQALDMISGPERIHLVTLDLAMPEMNGVEVLQEIRRRRTATTLPIIVATAYDSPEIEMEIFEAGADDFVVKPLDPARFLLRVQAVLRRHQSRPAIAL